MKRVLGRSFLIVICVLLGMASSAGHAQAAGVPLLLGLAGDIYSYSAGSLKNLTEYGHNGRPVLSPDGKYVAYTSIPKTFLEDEGRSGPTSLNIWLMELSTGNAKRIADQPPDTRKPGDMNIRPFTTRSDPRWSPDSKYLAWNQLSEGTGDADAETYEHLMVYTLATGKTKEIYRQQIMGIGASPIEWLPQGIGLMSSGTDCGYCLRVLDINGKVQTEFAAYDYLPDYGWLIGEQSPTIIGRHQVVSLSDGSEHALSPLVIYSLNAPDGIRFVSDSGLFDANWTLVAPGVAPVKVGKVSHWENSPDSAIAAFAISPDGKMAAYTTDDGATLYVFDGTQSTKVDLSAVKGISEDRAQVSGLAWSALGIRLQADH
jgi:dipeptidyl aminopeptidase/acylaminoacyl peptidase